MCCEAGADDVTEAAAKLANSNKRYYNNIYLALSMATWITLFGLPVYSAYWEWLIFGNKERCGPNKMGLKANVGTEHHPILVNMNTTLIADGIKPYAWCGFLPASYFVSWPAVVQTMLFTVYQSTGSSVKLAWQGCCGTFFAVLNIYILSIFFHEGAAAADYPAWVGWVDLIVVLFLFLASKAETNTMMYGMTWTVGLMLHFMNPNTGTTLGTYESPIPYVTWDGETTVDMLTAVMGCILAVIATVVPKPMLNIRNVHSDVEEIIKGIDQIFDGAIDYWSSESSGPKRYAVYAKMNALNAAVTRVQGNLADAYWETFDCCKFGKIRALYSDFYEAIIRNSDEVYLLKSATQAINFDSDIHKNIVKDVKPSLINLKNKAVKCLRACAKSCRDGEISDAETQTMNQFRADLEAEQQELSNRFQVVTNQKASLCSDEVAADSLFVFAIAQWAQETIDFTTGVMNFEGKFSKKNFSWAPMNTVANLCKSFVSTFDIYSMFDPEQLRYVFVSLLPVMLTFAISMYVEGSVFTRYAGTMPTLLTLLITKDHGIPFIKNAMRLTGVVFGHTLPLLVMSYISMLDCDSTFRFFLHMTSIWLFFFMFTFMYYASDQWSSVGCLVAGFGVYPMFVACKEDMNFNYDQHYKDIAQVIIAIMLKIFFTNVFTRAEPRDDAIAKMIDLNKATQAAFDAFFDGFFEGDKGLETLRNTVKSKLEALEAVAPSTDPSLAIVPGTRTAFKYQLLTEVLAQYRLLLSDLDMLVLAMHGHEHIIYSHEKATAGEKAKIADEEATAEKQEIKLWHSMKSQKAWEKVKADLKETLGRTFRLVEAVLEHATEEPMKSVHADDMIKMSKVSQLDGKQDLYSELSEMLTKEGIKTNDEVFKDTRIITQLRRTRITVVVNALCLSVEHTAGMAAACFDHMVYA